MGYRIIDHTDRILLKNERIKDRSLASAAQDIETIIKTGGRTPKDKGSLRARTRHEMVSSSRYRVVVPLEYAAFQERGSRFDGSHVVRHYTTPGTGKGWFQAAINTTAKNFTNLVKQAARSEGY